MYYPDFKYPEDEPSFMHHTAVLNYIEEYSKHFHLEQYIKFNNEVVHVEPMLDDEVVDRFVRWKVKTKDLLTLSIQEDIYDAIVICNGHYSVPNYLVVENIDKFEGEIIHSMAYRRPDSFTNQCVMLVGAGASAVDIAIDISKTARTVYIAHRGNPFPFRGFPENVIEKSNLSHVNNDGVFVLEDGELIQASVLLQCTGYEYSFPFLSTKCGISVKEGGRIVTPLYKHIVNPKYPSMGFIGLVWKCLTIPMFYAQCVYFITVFNKRESVLSEDFMRSYEEEYKEKLHQKGKALRYLHQLGDIQFDYLNSLKDFSGVGVLKSIEKLFLEVGTYRKESISGYKSLSLDFSE